MIRFLSESLQNEFVTVGTIRQTEEKTLKKMRHKKSGDYFFVREFRGGNEEAYRKLLKIRSPYLPEIFEVASEGDSILVVEEFIAGDSLQELIQGVTLSENEMRKITSDLCKALYTLHSAGIVHRDVKPGNIRIREGTNDAVLLDFDAARTMKADLNQDTVQLGTAGYAAPEQYGISQTDGRADIYALGVLMNLMLTGAHPSEKLAEGRMGRIISRCTMVHPDKRYTNVIRLMEALGI